MVIEISHDLPELFARSSTGKIKMWQVSVHDDKDGSGVYIKKRYGYVDAKIQENVKFVRKGKNIGKSNETTPWEQALLDAQSAWQSKKDQKYIEEIPGEIDYTGILLPMLAQTFQTRKHNIKYSAFIQPKMNGVRCLATKVSTEEVEYTSRNGKTWSYLSHLSPPILSTIRVGETLDGEIFHPEWTFQEIVRNVKKERETTKELQFWIYDKAVPLLTFEQRLDWLNLHIPNDDLRLVLVPTTEISCEEDVYKHHDIYVKEGFEGIIIRNKDGLYKFDHRSKDLQKYKKFFDKEFLIVGGKEGTGLEEGCVIFICQTKDKNTFSVRPKGSRELRRVWLQNIDKIIGKSLTVRYQEMSEDNIPIFPVGIAIRDYE